MNVLIKGMDIPKSCSDCPLNYDEMSCAVTGTRWWSDTMVLLNFDYTKERLYDCPLSEVPSAQKKGYTKADYIMALHKEYGCSLTRTEEAHNKALEYLQDEVMIRG